MLFPFESVTRKILSSYIHVEYYVQLLRTVWMAATKVSYLAPVTSSTILPAFRILNVGTTLIPSSLAKGCPCTKTTSGFWSTFYAHYLCSLLIRTLFSWLQSSFRKTTSRYSSANFSYFGAITLHGPHLHKASNNKSGFT